MNKHVFVSHSHKDAEAATAVVNAIEHRGIKCWVAPRDVAPGGSYAESILSAIETAKCFVLIYSEHSNMSSHVLREVERALKFGVNIVPIRFDNSTPSRSLDYLLATVHWLAISAEAREQSIAKVAEQIADWLRNFLRNPAAPLPMRPSFSQSALVTPLLPPVQSHRGYKSFGIAAALLVLAAIAGLATGAGPRIFGKNWPHFRNNPFAERSNLSGRPMGYAGLPGPQPARNGAYNNSSASFRPPPPPPPSNASMFGGPPDNQFGPPPPPPPPPGGPGFGPGHGPPPGGPPPGPGGFRP